MSEAMGFTWFPHGFMALRAALLPFPAVPSSSQQFIQFSGSPTVLVQPRDVDVKGDLSISTTRLCHLDLANGGPK